ncbi:hypothetical protein AGMMS49574_12470 [Bacteroidia bacterium]|nr:hypothetical protein AGMMS49574_12470 [Bacteroidia bacterium]
MKVVLDTNCLLISVQAYSDFFWLWKAFHYKKFVLCYTTKILNEYDEILSQYYSSAFAEQVIEAIVNAPNSDNEFQERMQNIL